MKQDYGFRRFLTRGNVNVKTEFLLIAFSYNINKYHSKRFKKGIENFLYEQQYL